MDVYALLDDNRAVADACSRMYRGYVREHRCDDPLELDAVWARVEADQAAGLHAVLLADYEWGARLLRAGDEGLSAADTGSPANALAEAGALRVLMFERLDRWRRADVDAWLAEQGADAPAGVMALEPSVDREAFCAAIDAIHAAIRAGETYQVNYTYRLHGRMWGPPLALYRALRSRQPVAYGAFVALPPGGAVTHVLSCSPELFLRHDAGRLTARPMKGTAPRITAPESDSETARLLAVDTKNRAENLMIVDLLRNDLGRLAETGSVKVPALFSIEPYATVFQMTSTVEATPRADVSFPALLRATFPCGSITGAPKHNTMRHIARLETTPRGLYCGAIGWADAPAAGRRLGDFCLSVAIRTLTLGASDAGTRPVRLGVGAGIVLDSRADDEFDECRLKARFVTGLAPGFELFETLYATRDDGARHVERHLARLAHSARVLGFTFDPPAALRAIDQAVTALPAGVASRLRLALHHDGRLQATTAALPPLPASPVGLLIAPERLPAERPLAGHKTTLRADYNAGIAAAEAAGAFDSLFLDADGRVVEGGRTNVFVRLDGRWLTPPLADGALPGVMRGLLLEDPAWRAVERTLRLDDLHRAERIVVCNALRGAVDALLTSS